MPTTLLIDLDEALSSFSQCQKGQKLCGCMIGLRFSSLFKRSFSEKLRLFDIIKIQEEEASSQPTPLE